MPEFTTSPAALVISTHQEGGEGGGQEQDHSLIYSFILDPRVAPMLNCYKGLALAVRGVLNSVCGQQARAIRLGQQEGAGVVLAITHFKTCMVVMALPGSLLDDLACQLVTHLTQTLVLVAGPPESWLVPDLSVGTQQPVVLRATVKVLLDSICLGVLTQLQGCAWRMALPGLVFKEAVPQLDLPADAHQRIRALLQAHQDGQTKVAPQAGNLVQFPPAFSFYQRHCCLMYRGRVVWSGLDPHQTKLMWQLCWSLHIFGLQPVQGRQQQQQQQQQSQEFEMRGTPDGSERASPAAVCHVTMHPVHTQAATSMEASAASPPADSRSLLALLHMAPGRARGAGMPISEQPSSPRGAGHRAGPALPQAGGGAGAGAAAGGEGAGCEGLVLAVLLRMYDDDGSTSVEQAVGQAEGQAAAALLSHIYSTEGPILREADAAAAAQARVLCPPSATTAAAAKVLVCDVARGALHMQQQGPAVPEACHPCAAEDDDGGQAELQEDVWAAVAACRKLLWAGQEQQQAALPSKHCRLRLTLGQIDQLSGARAPRDTGQRLGSADPAPWVQHPELASLAHVQQATVKVRSVWSRPADGKGATCDKAKGQGTEDLLVTGVLGSEARWAAYVIHAQGVDGEAIARAAAPK